MLLSLILFLFAIPQQDFKTLSMLKLLANVYCSYRQSLILWLNMRLKNTQTNDVMEIFSLIWLIIRTTKTRKKLRWTNNQFFAVVMLSDLLNIQLVTLNCQVPGRGLWCLRAQCFKSLNFPVGLWITKTGDDQISFSTGHSVVYHL